MKRRPPFAKEFPELAKLAESIERAADHPLRQEIAAIQDRLFMADLFMDCRKPTFISYNGPHPTVRDPSSVSVVYDEPTGPHITTHRQPGFSKAAAIEHLEADIMVAGDAVPLRELIRQPEPVVIYSPTKCGADHTDALLLRAALIGDPPFVHAHWMARGVQQARP